MKASLGALFALEKEIQSSFSLHPVLLHPPLQEECEASHGLKTTRPVDFFFFSWMPLFINILSLRISMYNTKGRVIVFLKLISL